MHCDVVVIGAGAAGIGAARRLRADGVDVQVLEAGQRVGGRAFTESAALGAPFDHGASWLHAAEVNPLTPLARGLGLTLREERRRPRDVLLIGDRPASIGEQAAYQAACDAFDAMAEARIAASPADLPLAEAVPRGGFWDATATHWLSAMISAVEASQFSARDYVATALEGQNIALGEGLGTLFLRLAEGLPIRLGAPVHRLRWGAAGVEAEGPGGTLRAQAAIVTVSTGVLAAGGLRFAPDLPAPVAAAIAGLPQGLLTKVALRASGAGRLGLGAFARVGRRVEAAGEGAMSWLLWPWGRDHVIGFLGGDVAWALAREGPAATEAHARAELARYFGRQAIARTFPTAAVVTGWAADPRFLGAYSHARVGSADARRVLGEAALAGGRLRFAGEACHPRYAATVGGAFESGEQAAIAVAAMLRGA